MNKSAMVNDIEIIYDDMIGFDIDYVKTVISNNYCLFLSLLGDIRIISFIPMEEDKVIYREDDVLYISDEIYWFDKFFYEIVKFNFYDRNIDYSLLLPKYYMEFLFRNLDNGEKFILKTDLDISDEMLYSQISYAYFVENGDFDQFVEYLNNIMQLRILLLILL